MTIARAGTYDQPTPDEELTNQDRIEIDLLLTLDNNELDRRVAEWISLANVDDQSGRRVFLSADLVERTFGALGRLIQEAERKNRGKVNKQAVKHSNDYYLALVRARDHAKSVKKTVAAARAAASPRQAAYRLLGELHRPDMAEITNRLRAGEPAGDVLADMRARRG